MKNIFTSLSTMIYSGKHWKREIYWSNINGETSEEWEERREHYSWLLQLGLEETAETMLFGHW